MKLKLFWPKFKKEKGLKGFEDTNKVDGDSNILINGLLFTCIILSLASGFVDIVTMSGLSKSVFHIGTVPFPAAILYTIISAGLILMKFWCAMKIGMLMELRMRLKSQGFLWYTNINRALVPWHFAHKFLIVISLITSMAVAVNSIGTGIRTMQQNINNMTADATQLIELNSSVNSSIKDASSAKKDVGTAGLRAQQSVASTFDSKWKYVEEYRIKRDDINEKLDKAKTDEEKTSLTEELNTLKSKYAQLAPEGVTKSNIDYVDEMTIKNALLAKAKKFETVDNSDVYEEMAAYDKSQIEDTLKALVDKEYRTPDGELIQFVNEDGSLVNVQLAISRLQSGISAWQNDSGDVGESAKVFTLVATYIKADEKAGGMGVAEWLLIGFIFFIGAIQEFCIKLATPAATIDRKTLHPVSSYCEWKDEVEKQRFLLNVYKGYVGDGVFTQEEYEKKCKECVELMEDTVDDIIDRYSKKRKAEKAAAKAKEKVIKEPPVRHIIKEETKVMEEPKSEKVDITVEAKPALKPVEKIEEPKASGYSDAVEKALREAEEL